MRLLSSVLAKYQIKILLNQYRKVPPQDLFALPVGRKLPRGNIHIGKYRLTREVSSRMYNDLVNRLEVEERNMHLLRHPFITPEQELSSTVGLNKKENWMNMQKMRRGARAIFRSVRTEDRLKHLAHNDEWERH